MNSLFIALFYFAFIIAVILLQELTIEVFGFNQSLLIWVAFFVGWIWLDRKNKYGVIKFFKDIHQSNLDDIKEQESLDLEHNHQEKI